MKCISPKTVKLVTITVPLEQAQLETPFKENLRNTSGTLKFVDTLTHHLEHLMGLTYQTGIS